MNQEQIRTFVHRYLDTTGCTILEKSPAYVTVKLSPEADRHLTNRSYYWNFVDRTGAEPETMTFTFVFDPEAAPAQSPERPPVGVPIPAPIPAPSQAPPSAPVQGGQPAGDSILGRYFGFVPTGLGQRVPRDELTFGSKRLEQIFATVKSRGQFVQMFEETSPFTGGRGPVPYSSWLCVNYKVEFLCDMKRDEIHSLAINLSNGHIQERFHDQLLRRTLTPAFPNQALLARNRLSMEQAAAQLEQTLEQRILSYDHRWADEAHLRWQEELTRVDVYYRDMYFAAEPEHKMQVQEQHRNRRAEIEWQYRPRVSVSAMNCGIFHLSDASRQK
jgi:hypothetical protein